MLSQLRPTIVLFVLLSLITGVAYPALMTVIGQTFFPHRANGSLIERGDQIVGSELIGQSFDDPRYFWGRLSATAPTPYNAAASSGSNLGPLNPAWTDAVKQRVAALRAGDPDNKAAVPVDLVTASGSGLDPHITPAAAEYQSARVARLRQMDLKVVRDLIAEHTAARTFGLLGEPRVNVLELNLALDEAARARP